jgi:hypothetical protein
MYYWLGATKFKEVIMEYSSDISLDHFHWINTHRIILWIHATEKQDLFIQFYSFRLFQYAAEIALALRAFLVAWILIQ